MANGETFWRFKERLKVELRKEVTREDCCTFEEAVRLVLHLDSLESTFDSKSYNDKHSNFTPKSSPNPVPMENDTMSTEPPNTNAPKLSKEELKKKFTGTLTPAMKEEMKKLGVCFYCREQAGHVAQECPKKKKKEKTSN